MEWSPLHFPKSGEPNKTGFEEIDCEWILKPTDRKWVSERPANYLTTYSTW